MQRVAASKVDSCVVAACSGAMDDSDSLSTASGGDAAHAGLHEIQLLAQGRIERAVGLQHAARSAPAGCRRRQTRTAAPRTIQLASDSGNRLIDNKASWTTQRKTPPDRGRSGGVCTGHGR
jgi:hypothetical protein